MVVDATGGLPWTTGLFVVVGCAVLGLHLNIGGLLPGWADPFNLCLTATAFLAPLGAGIATAHATQLHRSGVPLLARTTVKGSAATYLVAFGSVLFWQLCAFTVLLGGVCLRSNLSGASTTPMLLLPLSSICVIVAATAMGTWVGSRRTDFLWPPAVTMLVFGYIYVGSLLPGRWQYLSPIFPATFYQVYFQPNVALVGAQVLASVCIACLFLRTMVKHRRLLLAAVAVLAATVGFTVATHSSYDAVEYRAAVTPACERLDSTRLCVWPEAAAQLPSALRVMTQVRDAVAPELPTPARFHQPGLARDHGHVFDLASANEGGDVAFRFALAITPRPRCRSSNAEAKAASGRIEGWILARAAPGTITDSEILRVVAGSPRRQRTWVESNLAKVRHCG